MVAGGHEHRTGTKVGILMHPEEFASRRVGLGLSQANAGQLLGVKQSAVSNWERGSRTIPEGVDADLTRLEEIQADLVEGLVERIEGAEGAVFLMLPLEECGNLPIGFQRVCASQALTILRDEGVTVRITARQLSAPRPRFDWV